MGKQGTHHRRRQRQVCAEPLERRCLLSATLMQAGVDPSATASIGNTLFFLPKSSTGSDTALWKTDGTSAGTALVKDFSAANNQIFQTTLTVAGNRLYFVTSDQNDRVRQLWRSDGTPAGTTLIYSTQGHLNPYLSQLTAVGDKLFFVANLVKTSPNPLDQLLWTNATMSGAQSVTPGAFGSTADQTTPPSEDFVIRSLTAARGKIYAVVADSLYGNNEGGIWETDGTTGGTKEIAPSGTQIDFTAGTADQLLYSDDTAIWAYNGSTSQKIAVVSGSDANLTGKLELGGHLFFDDQTHQRILSIAEDTHALSWIPDDAKQTTWGELASAIVQDGIAYYLHNGTLWGTDGTAAGTIARGGFIAPDYSYLARLIGIAQNAFYYRAYSYAADGDAILTSDGPNGATRILNIPVLTQDSKLIHAGNDLYYFAFANEYSSGSINLYRFHPGLGSITGKVALTSSTPWFGLSGYRVYIDSNNNGKRDSGEASALTSRTGHVTIDNVAPGKVTVGVEPLVAGQQMTTPAVQTVTLENDSSASATFGFAIDPRAAVMAGSVSGTVSLDSATPAFPLSGYTVFIDVNNNGKLDSGEPYAVSESAGKYSIQGVAPGTVRVGIQSASAIQQFITPQIQSATLAPRGTASVHFGVASDPRADIMAGTLSGKVILNSAFGKLPLSGYRVFVDSNKNGVLDTGEPSAMSSATGRYTMSGVAPGTLSVRVVKLSADQQMKTPIVRSVALSPRGTASADFGFLTDPRSARISGMVTNRGTTTPAAGITVYIDLNGNGTIDDSDRSVQSAADGTYTFVGLPVGSYSIKFIPPAQTTADSTDAPPVIAIPARSNTGPDFSFTDNATVSGLLFNDLNGNGVRDAGEPGLGGVKVRLQFVNDDPEYTSVDYEAATRTRSSGRYTFSIPSGQILGDLRVAPDLTLAAGSRYSVGTPDQMETSGPTGAICGCFTDGNYYPPRVAPDQMIVKNYGITDKPVPAAATMITGTVFNDLNMNGTRDTDEGALARQHVWLDLNRNASYDANEPIVLTNSRGAFAFSGLAAGSNYLVIVAPSAGVQPVGAPGQVIAAGKSAQFAFTTNGMIAGTVYMDANQNGTKDAAESGMGGWTVFLDADGDGILDAGETSTTTDAAGKFALTAPAGTYRVRVVPQIGYRQTVPAAGIRTVTVSTGQIVAKVNFGEKRVS